MPKLRVQRILWAAMLSTVVIYAFLAWFVASPQAAERGVEAEPMLAIALAVAAVGSTVASFLLPRHFMKQILDRQQPAIEEIPDPHAQDVMFRDQVPKTSVLTNGGALLREMIPKWQTGFILSLALSESVAIYGLVLAFVGHPPKVWAFFMVVGAVLLAIRFPSEARLRAQIERHHGAPFAA
ncbi:MAG TPA: ATP synthase F0 subunit C [Polyangiaceae bacterium LLY-WYZ-15_(1-7)]|nr:hypothetical protein [Myxococcales bacterium]MAT25903.1 hypothetical protein [Sandaracinus sp.]HJK92612.1 ATP synthase F0 subunit C [Polyangiaceae bacterium LLY-WYZ-15_(1-7)]MBJ71428.1 hypothetical protein [Sandaracinus sp.]HJL10254.1 ATP synthase F0 subunit C [Polyangiaceae bacterium LLY-WYZ-15_(1-7)]